MRRRPKGTGTIGLTREGKYRARFPFKTGTREDIDGSPFATYEEAEQALDAILAALHSNGCVRGGITLKKLGAECLKQRELDGYRSVDSERTLWEQRFETWEAALMPASALTRGAARKYIAGWRNTKTGARLARQTRANGLNLLRAVYAYGVEHELVDENPCEGMRVKDHGRTEEGSTFLAHAESLRLLKHASDPGVELAVGTGMRSGELRTLHWEDVGDHTITVRYGGLKDGKLLPPKNGKIRTIPILPHARAALDRLRATTGEEKPTGIVLPSKTRYYRARGQVFDRLAWKAWLASAKLERRIRPHDLRHTCATLLLTGAWGRAWSYEEVKEMLGHSSVKVTERYAKAIGTLAEKAALEMAAKAAAALATAESANDKAATRPQPSAQEVSQACDILERRGSDSNRRMTVLQSEHRPYETRDGGDVAALARAYELRGQLWDEWERFVRAAANGDPTSLAKGLAFADAWAACQGEVTASAAPSAETKQA